MASSIESPDYFACFIIVVIPESLSLAAFGIKSDAVVEAVDEDDLIPFRNNLIYLDFLTVRNPF